MPASLAGRPNFPIARFAPPRTEAALRQVPSGRDGRSRKQRRKESHHAQQLEILQQITEPHRLAGV